MEILQELDNANLDYYSEKLNSIKKEYDEKWASSKSFLNEIKYVQIYLYFLTIFIIFRSKMKLIS